MGYREQRDKVNGMTEAQVIRMITYIGIAIVFSKVYLYFRKILYRPGARGVCGGCDTPEHVSVEKLATLVSKIVKLP